MPYDESTEQIIREDFKRLWATNFLDDLAIRVEDYKFSNGVIGKMVVYDMEERQRVKIVDYEGLGKVDQSKIEEALKEKSITIRLDSFIDPGLIRRVAGVVRELYAAEGYQFAEVRPEIKEVEGGTKLVHVTFHITEGPKVKIRDVDFVGQPGDQPTASSSRKMKENKEKGFFGFITGGGTYKEDKFAEDAQLVTDYYRDEGYIMAQVGPAAAEDPRGLGGRQDPLDPAAGPVTEGKRYAVGDFTFEGNKVVNSEALRPLFKIEKGETYSQKKIKKGLEKAQEVYGSGGYFEFTAYPGPASRATSRGTATRQARPARRHLVRPRLAPASGRDRHDRQGRHAARRRDDAGGRRQAVLHQPHHLRRQHDDARQRHPPRDAAGRGRRVQHEGAEGQRPPAQSARLLQAARRRGRRRPEDAERRQQGRHPAEVRRAEPQPADVRRRRLAVRRLLRPAVVPDVELPRPRRDVHASRRSRATAPRTTSSRSPSRSCSTGR